MNKLLTILMLLVASAVFGQVRDTLSVGKYAISTLGTNDYVNAIDVPTVITSKYGVLKADTVFYIPTTAPNDTVATLMTAAANHGRAAILFQRGSSRDTSITVSQDSLIFGSYGSGAKPKLYGSELITGWTLHSGNIWKATFATTITQLFVNDIRMQVARFPETGYAIVDAAPTTSSLTDAALNGALDYTGVICLIHSSSYGLDKRTVTSSSGTTLTLNSAPFGDVTAGEKYILVGKLEFLTVAGQWFYDDVTNTVYLWKTDGTEPTDTEVRGSTFDYGVYADGKDYVTVKNIETLHQKIDGIYFTNSDYFIFDNVTATDNDAVGLHNYLGHHGTIQNSSVSGANWYGIENYASSGNCIINSNIVSDIALPNNLGLSGIGAWYKGSGIYTQNSVTTAYTAGQINTVRYNRVDNIGYNGIHFANEGVVEYNYITNCGYVKNDGGFVYTSGGDAAHTGVNANSIIKHNIGLYGVGIGSSPYFEGIYADEYSENVTIEHNTVAYASRGLFLHRGNNHIVRYNTVFNTDNGLYISLDGDATELNNNLVYGLTGQEVIHLNLLTGTPIINSNNYINKYTANPFELDWTTYYTFTNWKSTTGHDALSTFDNTALTAGKSERLIINPTNAAKTFYLNNASNCVNAATGDELFVSFTVSAYSSMIVTGLNVDCIQDYSDSVSPVITSFTIPATATELIISISSFEATGSPVKYLLNESATTPAINAVGWVSVKPTTYTFTSFGTKTLYAWVMDAAGNISASMNDNCEITGTETIIGYNSIYASSSASIALRAMPITMTENGLITSISFYHNGGTGNALVGIYDGSSFPGNMIAISSETVLNVSSGWNTIELITPIWVESGTKVWLAVSTSIAGMRYETGTPVRASTTETIVYGMPNPFGGSEQASTTRFSIYCTYLK